MKQNNEPETFEVIHPLDDVAEVKHSPEGLGPMHMSGSVKYSLYALRGYLILMGCMVVYRVIQLATHHPHH